MRHGKYFLYGFLIYFQDFHIQNIFRKEFYRAGESIPERQGKDRDIS